MAETPAPRSVIVIGMDGLAWPVIEELISRGRLPSFRQVIDSGACWTLHSTDPPLTPAAWSTIFSGVEPHRHQVFDFTARERGSYSFRLCASTDRQAEMVWTLASRAGRSTVVLNVPMTYPPQPVNGIMVSGMDAPALAGAVLPEEALATVLAVAPGYTVDAMSHWFPDACTFRQRVVAMHEQRHRLAIELLQRHRPDLFICVYVLADRVQHIAWADPPSDEVIGAYELLDQALAEYLQLLGGEDTLLLLSDHGFQELRAEICLNRWLHEAGLLRLRRRHCRRLLHRHRLGLTHSRGVAEPADSVWSLPPRALWFDAVDWPRTRCAAFGLIGNLMLNLRGRDPDGVVREGERQRLLDEVGQVVRSAVERDFGKTPVEVHAVDWDHHHPGTVSPPDAVVEIDGYRLATWGGREFCARPASGNHEQHNGAHSPEGVLIAVGKRFAAAGKRGHAGVADVTPTILDLLDTAATDRRGHALAGASLVEV